MEPGTCDDCCFKCMRDTCGYICCCRNMKSSTRIKILWAWLITLATLSCLFIGCVLFSDYDVMASPSDMLPLKEHVDFLFCEKVTVNSPVYRFDGYLMQKTLTYSTKRDDFKQTTSVYTEAEGFSILPFYFLPSTSLEIKHRLCSQAAVSVYFIKGRKNLYIWRKNQYCDDCDLLRISLIQSFGNPCEDWPEENSFTFTAADEDEYFIVYSNEDTVQGWVDVDIHINRALFDLSDATLNCIDVNQCDFVLKSPQDSVPLIKLKNDENISLNTDVDTDITSVCVPRIWAYLLLHGVPVLILGIILTIVIRRSCRNEDEDDSSHSERSPLINSELPPSYSNVILQPPKYEDIVRSDELPSYAQAVATLYQESESPSNRDQPLQVHVGRPRRQTRRNRSSVSPSNVAASSDNQPQTRPRCSTSNNNQRQIVSNVATSSDNQRTSSATASSDNEPQCSGISRPTGSCNSIYESLNSNTDPSDISLSFPNPSGIRASTSNSSYSDIDLRLTPNVPYVTPNLTSNVTVDLAPSVPSLESSLPGQNLHEQISERTQGSPDSSEFYLSSESTSCDEFTDCDPEPTNEIRSK